MRFQSRCCMLSQLYIYGLYKINVACKPWIFNVVHELSEQIILILWIALTKHILIPFNLNCCSSRGICNLSLVYDSNLFRIRSFMYRITQFCWSILLYFCLAIFCTKELSRKTRSCYSFWMFKIGKVTQNKLVDFSRDFAWTRHGREDLAGREGKGLAGRGVPRITGGITGRN